MHVTALAAMQHFASLRRPHTEDAPLPWCGRDGVQARSAKGPARAARKALKLIKMTGRKLEALR